VALVLVIVVIYALAFVPLYRVVGDMVTVLAILPVAAVGLFLGLRAGLLAGLLGYLLNALLFKLAQDTALSQSGLLSSAIGVLVGVGAGWLSDLLERSQEQPRELAREREALREEIARRRQAEEALEKAVEAVEIASRAKSAFLSEMGHEMRTLLTPIIGYSELLQDQARDLGYMDFIPDLEKLQKASRHLLTLINDVIDLAKIEAGMIDLYLEPFSLTALMREVVVTAQPLVEGNGNTLETYYTDDLGTMYADLARVRQILLNLINNAASFTQQGRIVVTVLRETTVDDGDWLRFSVADTGTGMTPEQMQNLFQSSIPADVSTAREYGGSGLELAISYRLCQIMGGEISVESEVSKGSTFIIHLPTDCRGRIAGFSH
jgi:signal transduction histidine kinase